MSKSNKKWNNFWLDTTFQVARPLQLELHCFWSQIAIAALLQWIDYYHSMEGLGWDRGDFSMEVDAFRYP